TRQVLLRADELRLVLALFCYGLIERRFQGCGIDPRQHVAPPDLLALIEIDRDDLAVDLRANGDSVERLDRAEGTFINRYVVHGRLRDRDRHQWTRRRLRGLRRGVAPRNDSRGQGRERYPGNDQKSLPGISPGHSYPHGLAMAFPMVCVSHGLPMG